MEEIMEEQKVINCYYIEAVGKEPVTVYSVPDRANDGATHLYNVTNLKKVDPKDYLGATNKEIITPFVVELKNKEYVLDESKLLGYIYLVKFSPGSLSPNAMGNDSPISNEDDSVDYNTPQALFQTSEGFVDKCGQLIQGKAVMVEEMLFPKLFSCQGEDVLPTFKITRVPQLSQRSLEDVIRNLVGKLYNISGNYMPTNVNYKGFNVPVVQFETVNKDNILKIDYDPILQPLACSHRNEDKLRFVIVTCKDGKRYACKAQTLDEGKTYQMPKPLPKTSPTAGASTTTTTTTAASSRRPSEATSAASRRPSETSSSSAKS